MVDMIAVIDHGFEQAWMEGESECGLLPDERSPQERAALVRAQNEQLPFIEGFADAVADGSRANGGLLNATDYRVDMWVNRYNEIVNQARVTACGDLKYEWVLGPAEHCPDCLKLAGKVKRGSYWKEMGILPQSSVLFCGGYNCKCKLVPTDKPLSRGPLPKLIGPSNLTIGLSDTWRGRQMLTGLLTRAGYITGHEHAE